MSKTVYAERRARLMKTIGERGVALIAAAPEHIYSPDIEYLFRQNPHFYYLSGFQEPEALMVLLPGRAEGEFVLFNRPKDPEKEIWMGPRAGQEGAISDFQADQAYPIGSFQEKLPELLKGRDRVFTALTESNEWIPLILNTMDQLQRFARAGVVVPKALENVDFYIQQMRLIKDAHEIALMKKAADISAKAHCMAMQACRPGMMEYELDAIFLGEFKRQNCFGSSYPNIVGSGNNATVLHYHANNGPIQSGDLVLIDAGCEYQGYAADITRTFPANGKFTADQRALYQAVLDVQKAAIQAIKPGFNYNDYQKIARVMLTEKCVALGLLKGDPQKLYEAGAYKKFYMHNLGHWLGMDAHDHLGGAYCDEAGHWLPFRPGMVITAEPGLYIAKGTPDVDPKWWGLGIRIEDDVLVTESGCEILSHGVPKEIDAIEALMAGNQ